MSTPPSSNPVLDRLLKYLELDERNRPLRQDALQEACRAGAWLIARKLVEDGLLLHPDEAGLLELCGVSCLRARRYDDAEHMIALIFERGAGDSNLRYSLALAMSMQGRHGDALEQLSGDAVIHDVEIAPLLKARCLHHLDRLDDAIVECSTYLSRVPRDANGHGVMALLLYDKGGQPAASRHCRTALELDPSQCEGLLVQALIQQDAREMDGALATFDRLVSAHPTCGRGWLGKALINMGQQRMAAANEDIELAIHYMPMHIGSWHVLAWILILQGDAEGAERAFRSALELDRTFAETHGGLAAVAALQGREDEARAGIRRARGLSPDVMSAVYAEFVLFQRDGRDGEARRLVEAFVNRAPKGREIPFRESLILQMLGTPGSDESDPPHRTLH